MAQTLLISNDVKLADLAVVNKDGKSMGVTTNIGVNLDPHARVEVTVTFIPHDESDLFQLVKR